MNVKNMSGWLIRATVVIAAIRYMGSFIASDQGLITGWLSEVFTILLALAGMSMGIVDSIGTALLFNGWRKVMPANGVRWNFKFKMLTFFVFGLFVSSMTILVPFTLSRIEQVSIAVILGGRGSLGEWTWGLMVNAIPILVIGGVSLGNKYVEDLAGESDGKLSGNFPRKLSGNFPASPSALEKVTRNLPANWRHVLPTLDDKELLFLANAQPREIVARLRETGLEISPRTASNWHYNARSELNMLTAAEEEKAEDGNKS